MLKTVKNKIKYIKKENMLLKEERIRIARERTEKEAREECERIKAEKDALMELSEKELIVEVIMALKGYNIRINNIENQQNNLKDRIDFLETDIYSLKSVVDEWNNNR